MTSESPDLPKRFTDLVILSDHIYGHKRLITNVHNCFIQVHTHVYTQTCTKVYTQKYTNVHAQLSMHKPASTIVYAQTMSAQICIQKRAQMFISNHSYTCTHAYTYMNIQMYMHQCTYTHVFIRISIHRCTYADAFSQMCLCRHVCTDIYT